VPIDPKEDLLREIASSSASDIHLERILLMVTADPGAYMTLTLTVVAGGAEISGLVTTPEQGAARFDELLIESGDPENAPQSALLSDHVTGVSSAADLVKRGREQEAQMAESIESTLSQAGIPPDQFIDRMSDVPDETIRNLRFLSTAPPHVWILNATVVPAHGSPIHVPLVRVRVTSIDAWWLGARMP